VSLIDALYPVADYVNRKETASSLTRDATFREHPF
jgi:hypothetical protein